MSDRPTSVRFNDRTSKYLFEIRCSYGLNRGMSLSTNQLIEWAIEALWRERVPNGIVPPEPTADVI